MNRILPIVDRVAFRWLAWSATQQGRVTPIPPRVIIAGHPCISDDDLDAMLRHLRRYGGPR